MTKFMEALKKWFAELFAPKVKTQPEDEKENKKAPPWFLFAKRFSGKKETDPEFNKQMSAKWPLVGLNLGTISKNWAAWCGLAIAVALSGVGLNYAKDGALARNWGKYGVAIDWKKQGIPRGAIVWVNHSKDCKSSSNNHVTMADGDCSPQDLMKSGARFNGYGGNQNNQWKVSSYSVSVICDVRWPTDYEKREPITKSIGCSGSSDDKDPTQ